MVNLLVEQKYYQPQKDETLCPYFLNQQVAYSENLSFSLFEYYKIDLLISNDNV